MQWVERQYEKLVLWTPVLLLVFTLTMASACKKEEDSQRVLSTRDKILGTWRRSVRGWDHNRNGVIDSAEVIRAPATDTVVLTLVPDATYTRIQRFKGQDLIESTGTWRLQNNDLDIVIHPSTSTSRVDTLRLDSVSQQYFIQHSRELYYEAFVRPR